VPFARFVVQHQHELTFPFKRFQIQPVWRADRPQHGRYQEFYQCDADVVGSDSLLFEVDFVAIFNEVLSQLRLPAFTILINNRKILSGIAEVCGEEKRIIDITVAIDKLDKIGVDGVINELIAKGLSSQTIEHIRPLFEFSGSNEEKLTFMKHFLSGSEIGMKGIEELTFVLDRVGAIDQMKANVVFDFTLARGLNYYTGAIFEVKADGVKMGSICGGGRYDDLTGLFGVSGLSGIGISFGADRIYDVLEELNLFPESLGQSLQVLFVNFGSAEQDQCLNYCHLLRKNGVSCEVYPSSVKMQKQMKYANDRKVPFVAMVGEEELKNSVIRLKNMSTGEQQDLSIDNLISQLV
jgi:histidyl-tRNA synthetase